MIFLLRPSAHIFETPQIPVGRHPVGWLSSNLPSTAPAHLIQRNTSIEALNLLILLRDREETEAERQQQLKRTMDAMELMQQNLQGSVDRVREAPREALIEAGEMIAQVRLRKIPGRGRFNSLIQLFRQYSVRVDELHHDLALQMQQSHEHVVREVIFSAIPPHRSHPNTCVFLATSSHDVYCGKGN